jgi:hypothetical protein
MVEVRGKMDDLKSRSRDDLWPLAGDWISKIERAYQQYTEQRNVLVKNLTLYVMFLAGSFFAFVFAIETTSDRSNDFIKTNDIKIAFIVITALLFSMAALEIVRRLQILNSSRDELQDLLHISEELLQMIISSEERRSGGKYEYLINHVRILEIKHLLKKIESVVRIKFPFAASITHERKLRRKV